MTREPHPLAAQPTSSSPDLIPVIRRIPAANLDPQQAYRALSPTAPGFLLEYAPGTLAPTPQLLISAGIRRTHTLTAGTLHTTPGPHATFPDNATALDHLWSQFTATRCTPPHGEDGQPFSAPHPTGVALGGLIGTIAFDAFQPAPDNPTPGSPDAYFVECRALLSWDRSLPHAHLIYFLEPAQHDTPAQAWAAATDALNTLESQLGRSGPEPPAPTQEAPPQPVQATPDDPDFIARIQQAQAVIATGELEQLVLSRRFTQPRAGLDPLAVYRELTALNPSPYHYYVDLGPHTLVGASPELLVRYRHNDQRITVRPIAGTYRRGSDRDSDTERERALFQDPKEMAEHAQLRQLSIQDLDHLCLEGTVHASAGPILERYSHVMHLVSEVTGQAKPTTRLRDILALTFPAGTLSGAPRPHAMQHISALEPQRRGFYGGAIGLLSYDGDLEFSITIRTLIADADTLSVQAGAGIVAASDLQAEADETRAKAQAVLTAIDRARRPITPSHRGGA